MSHLDGYRISHAQNREDLIIAAFFPDVDHGFYIDAGSGHPEILSVSKHFYDRGWSGINVEPIEAIADLVQEARPRDVTLAVALGDRPSVQLFREYPHGSGLSTLSPEMMREHEQSGEPVTAQFIDRSVQVVTLAEILELLAVPDIHFLKIDVEGSEYAVLSGNDWARFRPQLLCVEANHMVRDWRPVVREAGYERVHFDGLNEYYLAEESMWRRDLFDYVDTLLATPVIDGPSARKISMLEALAGDAGANPDADAHAELAVMLSSRSWRLTAPLRKTRGLRDFANRVREWTTDHVVGPVVRGAARYPSIRRNASRVLDASPQTRARLHRVFDAGSVVGEPLRSRQPASARAEELMARLESMVANR